MSLLSKVRTSITLNRTAEEALYEMALDEFEAGDIRRGLWAQALAEAQGDEARAKGCYLKLRVRAMQDDGAIMDAVLAANPRNASGIDSTTPPSPAAPVKPSNTEGGAGVLLLLIAVALIAIYAVLGHQ